MTMLVYRCLDRVPTIDDNIPLRVLYQEPRHRNLDIPFTLVHLDVLDLRAEYSGLEHMQFDPRRLSP
ncbi:hypothetical protein D3C71_2049000 [compost metagenome]